MDLFRLVYWMQDIIPTIRELDGYLFFDRFNVGDVALRAEAIKRYSSLSAAQSWINIVLLDQFISEIVGDQWDLDDPLVDKLLATFESAWSYQIKALFPNATFVIEKMRDSESGDVGLRLISNQRTQIQAPE